jgi:hypothetical protein
VACLKAFPQQAATSTLSRRWFADVPKRSPVLAWQAGTYPTYNISKRPRRKRAIWGAFPVRRSGNGGAEDEVSQITETGVAGVQELQNLRAAKFARKDSVKIGVRRINSAGGSHRTEDTEGFWNWACGGCRFLAGYPAMRATPMAPAGTCSRNCS